MASALHRISCSKNQNCSLGKPLEQLTWFDLCFAVLRVAYEQGRTIQHTLTSPIALGQDCTENPVFCEWTVACGSRENLLPHVTLELHFRFGQKCETEIVDCIPKHHT
eukprot:5080977-Amphidinium_carterae.2